MIASLPMYDRWEIRAATDKFWQGTRDALRDSGIEAPENLTRDLSEADVWTSPDLVLSQTCGRPIRLGLHADVTVVARADYDLGTEVPGDYFSVIVTPGHKRDLPYKGALTVAVNSQDSQSGWAALRDWCAVLNHPIAQVHETGSHAASARLVHAGRADVAAIDAQTWRLLLRYDGWASDLYAHSQTPPTPGLPFITGHGRDPAPYLRALRDGLKALSDSDRRLLCIEAIVPAKTEDYLSLPETDTRAPTKSTLT